MDITATPSAKAAEPIGHAEADLVGQAVAQIDWAIDNDPWEHFSTGLAPLKPHKAKCPAARALREVAEREDGLRLSHFVMVRWAGVYVCVKGGVICVVAPKPVCC